MSLVSASCDGRSSGTDFPSEYAASLARELARPSAIEIEDSVLAVFAAADSACATDAGPESGGSGHPDYRADGSRHESTQLVRSMVGQGPQPPLVMRSDLGWAVGQIEVRDDGSSFPGAPSGLPVVVTTPPDGRPGTPGARTCMTGEPCELILPGIPPMHVHEVFSWREDTAGAGAGRHLDGERTMAVLRQADTVPFGSALGAGPSRSSSYLSQTAPLLLWWIVPCGLLVATIVFAINATQGPVVHVHKEVWVLVYAGVCAIAVLALALADRKDAICSAASESLGHLAAKGRALVGPELRTKIVGRHPWKS